MKSIPLLEVRKSTWGWPWMSISEEAVESHASTNGRQRWLATTFVKFMKIRLGSIRIYIRMGSTIKFSAMEAEPISDDMRAKMLRTQQENSDTSITRWSIANSREE